MGAAMGCLATGLFQCGSAIACACCTSVLNFTLSQASRFGHMLVVLLTFTLAIVLGTTYPEKLNGYTYYTQINLTGGCAADYEDNCIYRQLIYRASLSLFVLFSFLALSSYGSDMVNRSFWMMKFGLAIGLFCAFWWVDNSTFANWAELARVVSFGWLLVQGLLLIDFSHDAHDLLMNNDAEYSSEDRSPFVIYLSSSVVAFGAAVVGLVFLFLDYTGCDMGMFFTILTLVMGVFTTIVSLLESVGRGLLTPCIMFAYSVFLCWYALLSNPHDSCNPTANNIGGAQTGAIIVVGVISIIIMMYCVINGTKILNIFNPSGEGVMMSYSEMSATRKPPASDQAQAQLNSALTGESVSTENAVTSQPSAPTTGASENTRLLTYPLLDNDDRDIVLNSGTPHERAFYHVLMMLVACYGAMILTNWGRTDGAPASYDGDHVSSNESMWLKIVSQWVFLILYCRVLQVAYENNL